MADSQEPIAASPARVLGLDPSSRCVGYALLSGLTEGELIEAGRITPESDKRSMLDLIKTSQAAALRAHLASHELTAWRRCRNLVRHVRAHLASHELTAWRRCRNLVRHVRALVEHLHPDAVVIEIPSGLIGTGARHGARGSLTTYGLAAGMILETCGLIEDYSGPVIPVTERQWTAGQGNKTHRQVVIAGLYPRQYRLNADAGGDMADAIGIGRWWLERRVEHVRRVPCKD